MYYSRDDITHNKVKLLGDEKALIYLVILKVLWINY